MDDNLERLALVARRLGDLREELVFAGGSVLGLLINDPAQPQVRPTLDVDLVVGARTRAQFYRLQEKLRQRGFREDPSGPVCRWLVQGVPVDLMPAEDNVLGFTNQWYQAALGSAEVRVVEGMTIRVISPPCFLATKLEAFRGRGREDFVASHDLEDLVAVVDGRPEVVDETARAEPKLRRFLASEFRNLLDDPRFGDALPGLLFPDQASQQRLPLILERLERLAALA